MALKLNDNYVKNFITDDELKAMVPAVEDAHQKIVDKSGEGADFLGWVDLPVNYDKEEFERIKKAAAKIKSDSQALVVIGIGGSYLGARAAIEFCTSQNYNLIKKDTPNIYFSGNSISGNSLSELVDLVKDVDFSINVISKSGTTTEPAIAFRIFRELLIEKYGEEEASKRIYVTTDKARGTLKEFSDKAGYETFVVPDDVGGRYSVLTAVGLLPIAVAGIDIEKMMQGAQDAREAYSVCDIQKNDCYKYAAIRNVLLQKGKAVELMVAYEPDFTMMNEWFKQLYGESEGKDGKGIFPSSVICSTDLHSMGQYIQDGVRMLFETSVMFTKPKREVVIKEDEVNADGLNFLAGQTMDYVNRRAYLGTLLAHVDGGVPNICIEIPEMSEYEFGYLVYFFEKACAISGYILGVNPFNQPGVESYKKNMFALLGKPGYEAQKEELLKRINF
ncbi:MAG: glucose-6-phosphate isomerase [Clostridia bacterium]|nr:glucose-6-phosphate isomerase [Oscillospiraceae bacterium]MBQ3524001.1 glucose-6-phosphate isomerase [Clostridia bacterium]